MSRIGIFCFFIVASIGASLAAATDKLVDDVPIPADVRIEVALDAPEGLSRSSGAWVGKAKSTIVASQAKVFCGRRQLQTVSTAPGVRSSVARAPPGQRMQNEARHIASQQTTPKMLAKKK